MRLEVADRPAFAEMLERLGDPVPRADVVRAIGEETLERLLHHEILVESEPRENADALRQRLYGATPGETPRPCKHLVIGVTGAVAALHVMPIVAHLSYFFAERVDVILTKSAARFLRPELFTFLGVRTWVDAFEVRGEINVPHIHLAKSASMVLVAPATAHTVHRLAHGACSDLLSLVVAATKAPVVVCPSMNSVMSSHPAVARNLDQLRRDGMFMALPSFGYEVSDGHNAKLALGGMPADGAALRRILEAVLSATAPKSKSKKSKSRATRSARTRTRR